MSRGNRRRIAPTIVGLLVIFGLSGPSIVRAAASLSVSLGVSSTSVFTDDLVTLTATTTPAVENLQIRFTVSNAGNVWATKFGSTNAAGVATATVRGTTDFLVDAPFVMQASFDGDSSFDAATSNEIEVTFAKHPTTMTVTWGSDYATGVVNTVDGVWIRARIQGVACDGDVGIGEFVDGYWNSAYNAQAHLIANGNGTSSCGVDVNVGQRTLGDHSFRVTYGNSWTNHYIDWQDPFVVSVTLIHSNSALQLSPPAIEVGTSSWLTATVSSPKGTGYVESGGSFTFYDGATVLGTQMTQPGVGTSSIQVTFDTVGVHPIHATWNGSTIADPSTSPIANLTVSANVAHASGLGVSASVFYPIVDGYADTVGIKGILNEDASVAVTIRNATTNAVVRTLSVAQRGEGPYSVSWNGRSSSGSIVAAGTYRVTQVVTDTLGAKLTVTSTVTVSHRKLYWYSGSVTKNGNKLSAKGASGGSVTTSGTYAGGVRISLPLGTPGRWAAVGYAFSLPTATTYSSLTFWVLGSGTHTAQIGMEDRRFGSWTSGSAWIIDYFRPLATVTRSYAWTKVAGSSTYNRVGRSVRGMVMADNWSSGRYDIAKVKLSYRYAILK